MNWPSLQRMPWPLLLLPFFASCGGGGGGGGLAAEIPSVVVTSPSTDVAIDLYPPKQLSITFADRDPTGTATMDLIADVDGLPGTTTDQILIARRLPPGDGTPRTITWVLDGQWTGTYRIMARVRFGADERLEVSATAPGRVTLNSRPELSIHEPAGPRVVSRGGHMCVGYALTDLERDADVTFRLDEDGRFDTLDDARFMPPPASVSSLSTKCTRVPVAGIPLGTYRVLMTADDGRNGLLQEKSPGTIQVENVAWARSFAGTGSETPTDAVVLADGSLMVVGSFEGTCTWGAGTPDAASLTSTGDRDMFMARYNIEGRLRWVRSVGGPGPDVMRSIRHLSDGSLVVAGTFSDEVTFGPGEANETTLLSAGFRDVFLARLQVNGDLVWAHRDGRFGDDVLASMRVQADDSITVVGQFTEPIPAALDNNVGYVVDRYTSDGWLTWSREPEPNRAASMATACLPLADGSLLVTGWLTGQITFGFGEVNQTRFDAKADQQMFVMRLDANGFLAWARITSGTTRCEAVALAQGAADTFYVGGTFQGTVRWRESQTKLTSRTAAGGTDGFLASFKADGLLRWVRRIGSPIGSPPRGADSGQDAIAALAETPDGGVLVCGHCQGETTFENAGSDVLLSLSDASAHAFLANYDVDGGAVWTRADGNAGIADVRSTGLATAIDGSCFLLGTFTGPVTFGIGAPRETALLFTGSSGLDAFLTRINADGAY